MSLHAYGLLIGKITGFREPRGREPHWLLMVQPGNPHHPPYRVAVDAPTSFCCSVHVAPLRVHTHAAPMLIWTLVSVVPLALIAPDVPVPDVSSPGPPMIAVSPSPDSATEKPCWDSELVVVVPTRFSPCWLHTPPLSVNTHAAPRAASLTM